MVSLRKNRKRHDSVKQPERQYYVPIRSKVAAGCMYVHSGGYAVNGNALGRKSIPCHLAPLLC